jgi:hypothetical protein
MSMYPRRQHRHRIQMPSPLVVTRLVCIAALSLAALLASDSDASQGSRPFQAPPEGGLSAISPGSYHV